MQTITDQGKGCRCCKHSLKRAIVGATLVCLTAGGARESKADAASCPSSIPFGFDHRPDRQSGAARTQARNGVEFAVDEINANGGIAGKKLAFDHRRHRRLLD